jgi:hypothetical protein
MGCGCNSQEVQSNQTASVMSQQVTEGTSGECEYTKELAALWLEKVNCIKDSGLYVQVPNITKFQLNLYIGILTSVQNYRGDPCYFRKELEEIDSFISVITSMNLCLTQ